jgi:hypothetical protein
MDPLHGVLLRCGGCPLVSRHIHLYRHWPRGLGSLCPRPEWPSISPRSRGTGMAHNSDIRCCDVRCYDESSIPKQSYVGLEADTPSGLRPILLLRPLRLHIHLQGSRKLALQVSQALLMPGRQYMIKYEGKLGSARISLLLHLRLHILPQGSGIIGSSNGPVTTAIRHAPIQRFHARGWPRCFLTFGFADCWRGTSSPFSRSLRKRRTRTELDCRV